MVAGLNLPGIGAGGGGSHVAVDVNAGLATAASVGKTVDEMQEVIKVIAQQASTGLDSWTGAAAGSFGGTHTDWNKAALTMANLLDAIRSQLNSGFTGYEEEDAGAATALGNATAI
ncbi:WXG100 family type VII secretion target [Gordonia sp. ABSL1-1]|uniref:WXG100 family type VII secretion target n=1 Tax=Gordonia sp. ABSL1-1 TaxID=3053923 RepID=UPI00257240DE|nr:WXG100 family type VII secretion target [Gordonia sp. ABSL1-1]MDL9936716.1 WXG100 family type VII secretion target [Gordonia sp. ABSL1-1]